MAKFSVVILTRNEEKNILDCLESIKGTDEIIVIDDNSKDRTEEVIKTFDKQIKIYKRALSGDFSAQRNFGLLKAKNEWVLFLDADERVPRELFHKINSALTDNKFDGFLIERRDIMWGRELKFGEAGNIKLLRFAKKNKGKWEGKVHEKWDIKGAVGELDNPLMHYPHQTISEFLSEVSLYSTIRANELKQAGIKVSAIDIILYPKLKFLLNYFVKLGFMDGLPGLTVALMMSLHSFLVRSKLWLLNNKN